MRRQNGVCNVTIPTNENMDEGDTYFPGAFVVLHLIG